MLLYKLIRWAKSFFERVIEPIVSPIIQRLKKFSDTTVGQIISFLLFPLYLAFRYLGGFVVVFGIPLALFGKTIELAHRAFGIVEGGKGSWVISALTYLLLIVLPILSAFLYSNEQDDRKEERDRHGRELAKAQEELCAKQRDLDDERRWRERERQERAELQKRVLQLQQELEEKVEAANEAEYVDGYDAAAATPPVSPAAPDAYEYAPEWDGSDDHSDDFDEDGYNRYGYDSYGYDRYGYDCDGYDSAGFNRKGFNRGGRDRCGRDEEGYDINGFSIDGRNREGLTFDDTIFGPDGYDKSGFDKYGYDRDGYDREGYNREGYDRVGRDLGGYDEDGYDQQGRHKFDVYLSDEEYERRERVRDLFEFRHDWHVYCRDDDAIDDVYDDAIDDVYDDAIDDVYDGAIDDVY